MSLSSAAIRAFATVSSPSAEVDHFGGDKAMSRMLAKAREQARKDAEKVISSELADLVNFQDELFLGYAASISDLNAEIREVEAAEGQVRAALDYGVESGNYLPWLAVLGKVSPSDYAAAGMAEAEFVALLSIPEEDGEGSDSTEG